MSKKNFYAVSNGLKTGIFNSWSEVEPLVKGFPGAKFAGFATREEAEAFMDNAKDMAFQASDKDLAELSKEEAFEFDYVLYSDGGARPNPGVGGYGVVILNAQTRETQERNGSYKMTTNNRMELMGAIEAIKSIPNDATAILWSDSSYVIRTMNGEYKKKTNLDLWKILDFEVERKKVRPIFRWVKGHEGGVDFNSEMNERCDDLATDAIEHGKHRLDTGYQG